MAFFVIRLRMLTELKENVLIYNTFSFFCLILKDYKIECMLELKIKNEKKEDIIYHADKNIVEGLYLTVDSAKVKENCKALNIDLSQEEGKVKTVLKSLNKVTVVTIIVNAQTQFQYFVGGDLNLKALIKVDEKEMPNNIKEVVLKAYHIIQKSSLVSKIKEKVD